MKEHNIQYKNRRNQLFAVDFFCGGGGMTCGLKQAGINVLAGIDMATDCISTYEDNNPGAKYVCCDINTLNVKYLEQKFKIQRNDDNMIFVGCSPCQYYSIIHTSKEKAKKSKDLLMEFKRFVDYYNPGFVLVENVPGIMSREDSILPEFLKFLEEKKYCVAKDIINMSWYGVPQSRKRFSLVAVRLKEVKAQLPSKDSKQALLKDAIGIDNGFIPVEAGHKDDSIFQHSTSHLAPINLERLQRTPHNGGSRLAWKDDEHLQLNCYKKRDNSFRDVYGRLCWEKPSATITTNFVKITSGRFGHPNENRGLSLREGATIQTFPKTYIFKAGSMLGNARIIGNAVPPEYGRRLGETIKQLKLIHDNGTI